MNKIFTDERKAAIHNKFEEVKLNAKTKIKDGYVWCKNNPKEASLLLAGALWAGAEIKKCTPTKAEKEEKWRANHYYDDSTRTWYALRHDISEETRRQIYREQHDGRDLESILIDRKLYKREK